MTFLKATFQNRYFLGLETFILIILPLILLYFRPEFIRWRLLVIGSGLLYVFLIGQVVHWTPRTLGLTRSNLALSIKSVLLPSLLLSGILLAISRLKPELIFIDQVANEAKNFPDILVLLFYSGISVPLQELIFRGFYINRLSLVSSNPIFPIFYSSLIFGLIHFPFINTGIALGAFALSLWWSKLFLTHRNLFGPIISHALIGGVIILSSIT